MCFDLMVGITGFEPATFSSRTRRATKLRHIPRAPRRPSPQAMECTVGLEPTTALRNGFAGRFLSRSDTRTRGEALNHATGIEPTTTGFPAALPLSLRTHQCSSRTGSDPAGRPASSRGILFPHPSSGSAAQTVEVFTTDQSVNRHNEAELWLRRLSDPDGI